jgi:hypothetical protein
MQSPEDRPRDDSMPIGDAMATDSRQVKTHSDWHTNPPIV